MFKILFYNNFLQEELKRGHQYLNNFSAYSIINLKITEKNSIIKAQCFRHAPPYFLNNVNCSWRL